MSIWKIKTSQHLSKSSSSIISQRQQTVSDTHRRRLRHKSNRWRKNWEYLSLTEVGKKNPSDPGRQDIPAVCNRDLLKAEEAARNSVCASERTKGNWSVSVPHHPMLRKCFRRSCLRYMHHSKVRITVKVSGLSGRQHPQTRRRRSGTSCHVWDERNAFPDFLTFAEKSEPVIFVTHIQNLRLKKKGNHCGMS